MVKRTIILERSYGNFCHFKSPMFAKGLAKTLLSTRYWKGQELSGYGCRLSDQSSLSVIWSVFLIGQGSG